MWEEAQEATLRGEGASQRDMGAEFGVSSLPPEHWEAVEGCYLYLDQISCIQQ